MINFLIFWTEIIFDLYIFILMLQFLFLLNQANYFNPLMIHLSRLTNALIFPLRKILPARLSLAWVYLLVIILFDTVRLGIIYYLQTYQLPHVTNFIFSLTADLVTKFINFYFYAVLLRVILSWVATVQLKSLYFLVAQITEPLLRPVRRILPSVAGFDFSPWVVMVLLQLLLFMVVLPLVG